MKKGRGKAAPAAGQKMPKPAATDQPRERLRAHLVPTEELRRLRDALKEAQDTLDAIRSGEVDAVVVSGANGNRIYSLAGAEQPYRIYVEQMQEGAVTVSSDALVLYCNQRFATMLGLPLERVISSDIRHYLAEADWRRITTVFQQGEAVKHEADRKSVV